MDMDEQSVKELQEIKVILRDQLQDMVTLLRRINASLENLNK